MMTRCNDSDCNDHEQHRPPATIHKLGVRRKRSSPLWGKPPEILETPSNTTDCSYPVAVDGCPRRLTVDAIARDFVAVRDVSFKAEQGSSEARELWDRADAVLTSQLTYPEARSALRVAVGRTPRTSAVRRRRGERDGTRGCNARTSRREASSPRCAPVRQPRRGLRRDSPRDRTRGMTRRGPRVP